MEIHVRCLAEFYTPSGTNTLPEKMAAGSLTDPIKLPACSQQVYYWREQATDTRPLFVKSETFVSWLLRGVRLWKRDCISCIQACQAYDEEAHCVHYYAQIHVRLSVPIHGTLRSLRSPPKRRLLVYIAALDLAFLKLSHLTERYMALDRVKLRWYHLETVQYNGLNGAFSG